MIVFDVGHYPYPGDPGAYSTRLKIGEHEWCYSFASACMFFARQRKLFDVQIITRKTGIEEVSDRINRLKPKLVVSFHLNGFVNPNASGTECFYWHTSRKSKWCAEILQRSMVRALGLRDRGAKASGLPQLRMVKAPMVLIEPGFLTSDFDMKKLHDNYQNLIEGIVGGIKELINAGDI